MAEEGLEGGRVTIEATAEGVRVLLPGPRSRWAPLGLVLLVPTAMYVVFGSLIFANAALDTARSIGRLGGAVFVAALLLVPALLDALVLVALVVLLYHLLGCEVVTATPWMLTDTRRILLFGRRRRWPAMRVSGLRLSPMMGGPFDPRRVSRRGILFEVDGRRTRTIAEGCTAPEAAAVYAAVKEALERPTITR